jgi:hypothetical protein
MIQERASCGRDGRALEVEKAYDKYMNCQNDYLYVCLGKK